MRVTTKLAVAVVSQILCLLIPGGLRGQLLDIDNDYPNAVEGAVESTEHGNPLAKGDEIYSLRGSHRFFSGDLGFEASLGYAEPTSDFVRARGTDADLLLVDFSVVWYANYRYLNKFDRQNGRPWHRNSRMKPELIVFGGPGLAALAIDDPFPGADASKYFFTINAGVGAKLHWLGIDRDKGRDRRTSRFYLRPEVRARWFAGSDGEIDWGVGLALGYSFGNRPSLLSLRLKVHEGCKVTERYLSEEVEPAVGKRQITAGETDELSVSMAEYRRKLEELEARIVTCGPRCENVRPCLDDNIRKLNEAMSELRPGQGKTD